MAVATAETGHLGPPAQPVYRLHPGMMGMYIFLGSEVMFFGSMFAAYFYLFGSHPGWPPPNTPAVNWFPTPLVNTWVLLSSGVTCHFGLEAITHSGRFRTRVGAGILIVGVLLMALSGALAFGAGSRGVVAGGLAVFGVVIGGASLLAMLGIGPFDTARKSFIGLIVGTILLGAGFEFGQAYEFLNAKISFSGFNQFSSAFFTMTGFHGAHVLGGLVILTLILGRALAGHFSPQNHLGVAAATLYWHFVDVVWLALFAILYLSVAGSATNA